MVGPNLATVTEIDELAAAIKRLHGASAKHVESVDACEIFRGKVIWDGTVEIFDLLGHAKAKRCYAWKHWKDEHGRQERIVTVLEVPPVDSPVTAVRAAIVADIKRNRAN
jgi:hypothetical protein